ncbi:hypothetical protein EDB81DRAFT_759400 [Dactylonectria macrodidyma]|uniref:Uncharacterized protein n=1 Tax=Dactylonectria macrodidyma TaxID=307937 RepID=A0A9P9EWV4_9HYPO|nr:hypothetical protein EDB81DRAFT_759400 [Dactylonectria macrodidyma]
MATDVLNLPNYDKFTELNPGLNPGYIQAGLTYTVPFTNVNPPATWMTVGGCTPLLELNSNTQENSNTGITSTASTLKTSLESSLISKPTIDNTALLSLSSTTITSSSLSDKSATHKPSFITYNSPPTSTTKRITNTKTTSATSSEVTVNCSAGGAGNTTLNTLQKYGKKFCQNLDSAVLNGELQTTFSVGWLFGCEDEEQSIIELGSLCSAMLAKP